MTAAAVAGMLAGWLAADSLGFLASALRHTLTLAALTVVIMATWSRNEPWRYLALRTAAIVAGGLLLLAGNVPTDVLAVTLLLGVVAWQARGLAKPVLAVVTISVGTLAVFQLLCRTPLVWLAANAAGGALGHLTAAITGRPLQIGSSFACLNLLVTSAGFIAAWWFVRRKRSPVALVGAVVGIVLAHGLYLVILAHWAELRDALPTPPAPPEFHNYVPPPWHLGAALASVIPWQLPLLAGAFHLLVVGAMVRWSCWSAEPGEPGRVEKPGPEKPKGRVSTTGTPPQRAAGFLGQLSEVFGVSGTLDRMLIAAALVVPVALTLVPGRCNLEGLSIVALDDGSTDWGRPGLDDDQIEQPTYYALPKLMTSLGAKWSRVKALDESALAGADVLLMVRPQRPPADCERIWQFVRNGGTLLLLADTWGQQQAALDSFNRLLDPAAISVRFDVAIPLARRWEQGRYTLAHPATALLGAGGCWTALETGATLRVHWPARPILIGRWGWSDPGSDAVLTSTWQLDPGEPLGDLVLAAEQSIGAGKVVVLGAASVFSDPQISASYRFLAGLLAGATGRLHSPQALWRQVLGLIAALAIAVWVASATGRPGVLSLRAAAAALGIVAGLVFCGTVNWAMCRVLPDGRRTPGFNNLVYVDATHLEAYSPDPWSNDGLAGFELSLIRSDWLPLRLPDFRADRLQRAAMLVSIAPSRAFSHGECRLVGRFVEQGGTLIVMADADDAQGAARLLAQFHMGLKTFPAPPDKKESEPIPMGYFTTKYRPGEVDYDAEVTLFAGWPIECEMNDRFITGFRERPVISSRLQGRGIVMLIGDTAFAMNKNMWYVTSPSNVREHNAHFWRWLLSFFSDQEDWQPPAPEPQSPEPTESQQPNDQAAQPDDASSAKRGAKEPSVSAFAHRADSFARSGSLDAASRLRQPSLALCAMEDHQ